MSSFPSLSRRRTHTETDSSSTVIGDEEPRFRLVRTPTDSTSTSSMDSKIFSGPKILQDIVASKDGEKVPQLTIMEELLLLGINDKGHLSLRNEHLSSVLRCSILMELALRRRIALIPHQSRWRVPVSELVVEVIDDGLTSEPILDETLKMMKAVQTPLGAQAGVEKTSVKNWISLLSSEGWDVEVGTGYQLKQVRERLMKGLVDKGVLRSDTRNYLLFKTAAHPIADHTTKSDLIIRVARFLTASTFSGAALGEDSSNIRCPILRLVCLVCAAYTAGVLDHALSAANVGDEQHESALDRADQILVEFGCWPFGSPGPSSTPRLDRRKQAGRGSTPGAGDSRKFIGWLLQEVKSEIVQWSGGEDEDKDFGFELVAGVLEVFSKLD
ncbi:hypothetical protein D9758_004430 [Tetrapyrgos nigripes]|uniref:GPP34-domain-containing protein n=1 Tax=Tetrapyrgos nigripes TaxID=182062 RepID=A0A8H5GNJ9_9AGAR|nr:hypothetical protein D9758_004430 [Tetrapyrgos nigripes]